MRAYRECGGDVLTVRSHVLVARSLTSGCVRMALGVYHDIALHPRPWNRVPGQSNLSSTGRLSRNEQVGSIVFRWAPCFGELDRREKAVPGQVQAGEGRPHRPVRGGTRDVGEVA
jgi:hypothetical protein